MYYVLLLICVAPYCEVSINLLMSNNNIEIPDPGCVVCRDPLPFDFTYAFQPIVDVENNRVFAYEALIRALMAKVRPACWPNLPHQVRMVS